MEVGNSRFSGPTPEVVYVPALFRKIQQGEIRVPAFQRGFVWTENKVIDLLKSIFQGFPIGSMLFWRVQEKVLKIETPQFSVFPVIDEKYPCNFILDGLQRLSSLYAVFHFRPDVHEEIFRIYFKLDTDEFEAFGTNEEPPTRSIAMWKLFSPKEFLEIQRELLGFEDADALLEKAVDLHSRFQEYLIPTVTISGRSPSDVVQVFERINSTAATLNAVDFMRAVTWSQDFDLNSEIEHISMPLNAEGFPVSPETVVKVLAVSMGKEPTPESMLELRAAASEELHQGVRRSKRALKKAIRFLGSEFHIQSYEFVPYEGQLLALTRFFEVCSKPTPTLLNALSRWYWTISFNEGLRGKPDHYVTRILKRVDELVNGKADALDTRLAISANDFIDRRFIRGKALSSAMATMFAKKKARSFTTGEIIPPADYMTDFIAKNFQPVLPAGQLPERLRQGPSSKLLANTILIPSQETAEVALGGGVAWVLALDQRDDVPAKEIRDSQFLSDGALVALRNGLYQNFLNERAKTLYEAAVNLASSQNA
jgi:hypothetical protein